MAALTETAGTRREAETCLLCGGTAFREMLVPANGCLMRRCRDCGLWVNAGEALADSADHYGPEYHDYHYGRRRHQKLRSARLIVRQLEGLCPGGRLLDVGCSFGHVLQAATEAGWDAHGVDVNEEVIARCRAAGLQARVADMGHLPFADATFDLLHLRHVLEHDRAVAANLLEMRRVLKPGGLLVVEVPDCACLKVRLRGAAYAKFWKPDHLVGFTPATLACFARRAGFEPVAVGALTGLLSGRSGSPGALLGRALVQLARRLAGSAKDYLSVWRKPAQLASAG